ncbi:hypothetical protein F5I97DRAFT_1939235 [Phlebopus sp. FC_14]|nr:hypothetical protein F5I97DRAFT_1939235 [Phlebopus sp. FC_14]
MGPVAVRHCVVLALLARVPAYATAHVPGPQAATYYAQRHSNLRKCRIETWKKTTDAVHATGSYVFCQLWAIGRPAIPSLRNMTPIAISELPCPLTEGEIASYIVAYDTAAHNAVHLAGFDGVDVHAANDYLVDQFIQSVNNTRTNKWSGAVAACVKAIGEERLAICPSPWSAFQGMHATFSYLVRALRDAHSHMANLHITKARTSSTIDVIPAEHENNDFLHEIWHKGEDASRRIFMSAGGDTRETALNTAEEKGDLVCSFL